MAALSTRHDPVNFAPIHRLAVRHRPSPLSAAERSRLGAALVAEAGPGFVLTPVGYGVHRSLLEAERLTLDVPSLEADADALTALARRVSALRRSNGTGADPGRSALLVIATAAETIFLRLGVTLPRLGEYAAAFRAAARALADGDPRYGLDPDVESIGAVFDDAYEDYLQTVGRGPEAADL